MSGFKNSINQILRSQQINSFIGIIKYFIWQLIKVCNLFPHHIKISNSIIVIPNKTIARQGGTKLYTQGMYDYNNMTLMRLLLKHGYTNFFDIGANIGAYALLASEIANAKVHAFEPHPYTFSLLKENILKNNRNNISSYQYAVGEKNSIVKFTDVPGDSMNKITSDNNSKVIETDCFTLNYICHTIKTMPDIVKIDVEGFEKQLLIGADKILEKTKLIFIEITENKPEIIQLLNKNGLLGPYTYNAKKATLNKGMPIGEDPIFIAQKTISDLTNTMGIQIEG